MHYAQTPPPHLPPLEKSEDGRDGSHSHDHSHVDSKHDIRDSVKDKSLMVSLRVCKQCHHALLGAFDHCLAKHGEPTPLESIHQVDEVGDAALTSEVPYFDIVKDPTRNRQHIYLDGKDKASRDQWVLQQKKHGHVKEEGLLNAAVNTGHGKKVFEKQGIVSGHVFSGGLYKRMLDVKDREIQQLREQLYEAMQREHFETSNVVKLRAALNKSVQYYTFAEEWQQSECARLQTDVKYLKAEASSLMAFLINAEEEKRKGTISERDQRMKDADRAVEDMKAKLHDSYKEFLAMDTTMARLRKEALKGTEAAESRNLILQKNLDKLSADFEVSAKELTAVQTKNRELEFELEEMVQQFNLTGEAKRKSEELNVKITGELDTASKELFELDKEHEQLLLVKAKLEADLRKAEVSNAETRREQETKIISLTAEVDQGNGIRKDLEGQLKSSRGENEKLNQALKNITRAKDQLEVTAKATAMKHEKELATRDARIKELVDFRADDAKTIKKQQEQKEQLMFQIVDLQAQLERETSNVNVLTFEMTQVKRQADEKATLLDEQIEKLTAAKSNLSNDKRQLTEKIKFVRADLRQKEEELDSIKAQFARHKEESAETEATLRKQLADLQALHSHLTKEFKSLESKHAIVVESSVTLKMKHTALLKKQGETETKLFETARELTEYTAENKDLTSKLAESMEQHEICKQELEMATIKVAEVSSTLENLKAETDEKIQQRNTDIARLSSTLYKSQQDNHRLAETIKRFSATAEDLDKKLNTTMDKLASETSHREQLETQLHENRIQYQSERRLRIEFERMQIRLGNRETSRDIEAVAEMRRRDRLLQEVSQGLHSEFDRLNGLASMLPTATDLGNMELANTKEFAWLFTDDKKKPKPKDKDKDSKPSKHKKSKKGSGSEPQEPVPEE